MIAPTHLDVRCPACQVVLVVPISVTAAGASMSVTVDEAFLAAHVARCPAVPAAPRPAPQRGTSDGLPPLS